MYRWWSTPGALPVTAAPYEKMNDFGLLYFGVAPSASPSKTLLQPRLVRHASGDASRLAILLTLGILFADGLGLALGVHKNRPKWGGVREAKLSRWTSRHARLAWAVHPELWTLENELLASATTALNSDGRNDAFAEN